MKLIISKKHLKIFMAAVVMVLGFMLWDSTSMAFSVKVTGDAVNVRSKADATSEIVANVKSGATFEGSAEETGADGKVWYKISINNGTGYIRSDFAQKSEGSAAASVPETVVTPIDNQSATIVNDNTNVRKQASTDAGKVATVKQGVAVTITGTATGTDNKTWYQVKFINNGSEVTGFVRYDLVKIGEGEAAPEDTVEEAPAEEAAEEALEDLYADMPAEEPASSNDEYEMVYTAGNDGVEAWYVYDHIENRRMKLDDLLAAESINANNMEIMEGKVSSMKVAVIVLAVLLVLALGAAAFFGLKWHESLDDYDDDDDDDEDEDDDDDFEEPQPVRRKVAEKPQPKKTPQSQPTRRPQQERQPQRPQPERRPQQAAPARKPQQSQPVNSDGVPMKRVRMADGSIKLVPADKIRVKSRPAEAAKVSDEAARRPQPAKDNWKSKNFLTEDEDLEFSFINDEE